MKIAIPDHTKLCEAFLRGEQWNHQGIMMGGHTDENDFHQGIEDRRGLEARLYAAGLDRIRPWLSEIKDCAAYEWSLNLMGYKPVHDANQLENVGCVLACPRYGPTMHYRCLTEIAKSGADTQMIQGCFWWQQLWAKWLGALGCLAQRKARFNKILVQISN